MKIALHIARCVAALVAVTAISAGRAFDRSVGNRNIRGFDRSGGNHYILLRIRKVDSYGIITTVPGNGEL